MRDKNKKVVFLYFYAEGKFKFGFSQVIFAYFKSNKGIVSFLFKERSLNFPFIICSFYMLNFFLMLITKADKHKS